MEVRQQEELQVDAKQTPVTVGMLASIAAGLLLVIGQTVAVCAYVSTIKSDSKDGIVENSRKIETLTVKFDAATMQRDLTMRNRDLQIDNLKSDVDKSSKRLDQTETNLAELTRKLERVLVLTESIKESIDSKERKDKP